MQIPSRSLRHFEFGGTELKLFVPSIDSVLKDRHSADQHAAYWARIWPSAIALCRHLAARPSLVAGKHVLELAAGLGLPGMLSARWAEQVTVSDYAPEAVALMEESVRLNKLGNIRCRLMDWNDLSPDADADVLLLSDINYAPGTFDVLYSVLAGFIGKGTTIVLATPQRLMAKPFIERLLPWCRAQSEQEILFDGERAFISILELRPM